MADQSRNTIYFKGLFGGTYWLTAIFLLLMFVLRYAHNSLGFSNAACYIVVDIMFVLPLIFVAFYICYTLSSLYRYVRYRQKRVGLVAWRMLFEPGTAALILFSVNYIYSVGIQSMVDDFFSHGKLRVLIVMHAMMGTIPILFGAYYCDYIGLKKTSRSVSRVRYSRAEKH